MARTIAVLCLPQKSEVLTFVIGQGITPACASIDVLSEYIMSSRAVVSGLDAVS